jgi:hypothetical protein
MVKKTNRGGVTSELAFRRAEWVQLRDKTGMAGRAKMAGRKAKVIENKKVRGEWAESLFVARASEHDLPVSKPWGDSNSFDCVVGRPGRFVAVQVKSTIAASKNGKGYICSVCSSNRPYTPGSFDFLAAYVVEEEAWYIVPAREIEGMKALSLWQPGGKYEKYLEAWQLLREATKAGEAVVGAAGEIEADDEPVEEAAPMAGVMGRMRASLNFARRRLEGAGVAGKESEE